MTSQVTDILVRAYSPFSIWLVTIGTSSGLIIMTINLVFR